MTSSPAPRPAPVRYRLRFLLQEFDLPQGETTIGRSDDCSITIFDPLVSRHHVVIRVTEQQVVVEDLSSRNGMRVNGQVLKGLHILQDGDRVRIGKNELVFKEIGSDGQDVVRSTGSLIYCADCEGVYPQEAGACPHCGSSDFMTEITRSGVYDDSTLKSWALDMLVDLLKKTMLEGPQEEAARILQHAMSTYDERLVKTEAPNVEQLQALGEAAIELSQLQGNAGWARWVERAYARANLTPPSTVAEALVAVSSPDAFSDTECDTRTDVSAPSDHPMKAGAISEPR